MPCSLHPVSLGARKPLQIPLECLLAQLLWNEGTHVLPVLCTCLLAYYILTCFTKSSGSRKKQTQGLKGAVQFVQSPVIWLALASFSRLCFWVITVDSIHKHFILLHPGSQPKRKRSLWAWAPTQSKHHFWLWTHYWFHFEPARAVKHWL